MELNYRELPETWELMKHWESALSKICADSFVSKLESVIYQYVDGFDPFLGNNVSFNRLMWRFGIRKTKGMEILDESIFLVTFHTALRIISVKLSALDKVNRNLYEAINHKVHEISLGIFDGEFTKGQIYDRNKDLLFVHSDFCELPEDFMRANSKMENPNASNATKIKVSSEMCVASIQTGETWFMITMLAPPNQFGKPDLQFCLKNNSTIISSLS